MLIDIGERLRTDVPNSARVWNYWMGGKDYYPADQIAGDAGMKVYPQITTLVARSRDFLARVMGYLTEQAGVRQFLDIGAGLPAQRNTHELAREGAPVSRTVYVDNDILVLTHARALLCSTSWPHLVSCVDADFHTPEAILAGARHSLSFDMPVAVLLMGVLGHAASEQDMVGVVATLMDAVPSGSYLALWDGTDHDPDHVKLWQNYAEAGGVPYVPRPADRIRALFDGLELLDPGFGPINHWRTDFPEISTTPALPAHGALARKP